ncbi:MAG: YegP family protein [Flavobacteriales bacterium]|nr:YegP family protein [Flavobacteriales bacterium]
MAIGILRGRILLGPYGDHRPIALRDPDNAGGHSLRSGASFNLLAANQQVVGSSQVYTTEASRDNGIESVKKNAPIANILEIQITEIS